MNNNDLTHPRTLAFWASRIFITSVILCVTIGSIRILYKISTETVNKVVHDDNWERTTRAQVAAIDSEIFLIQDAIQRNESARAREWISRETTRKVAEELSNKLLDAQSRRTGLAVALESK